MTTEPPISSDARHSRRQFLQHGAATIGSLSLTHALHAEPQRKINEPRKKLIAWGGIDWYSPATVQANIRKIEELPFDGQVLQGFKTSKRDKDGKQVMFDWLCFGQEQFDRKHVAQTVKLLKNIDFQRFTDNFLRFNVTPGDVDWFDDFSTILHNARLWAEVARETGMKGWAFDVEDYKGTVFDYRKMRYVKQKTFEAYVQQAQLRGRQFMEVVQKGYPDIVVLLMLAHSYVNRTKNASTRLAELRYGLLPAFLNGMLEAAGPQVTLIDGNEQSYVHLTPEDYFRGFHASRREALALVPPELHEKYRVKMDVGMAIYANYVFALTEYPGLWPTHFLTPEERLRVFEQNIYYALTTADEYVWLYSERMGWWKKGQPVPTPDGALDAIRSARSRYRQSKPLGFDMADRVVVARSTEKVANPWPSRDTVVPRVPAGRAAPEIDGILNDAVWKDVPPLLPFAPLRGSKQGTKLATVAQAAFDDEHLYIAFRCAEPERPISAGNNKDDDDIRKGDYVEVFLRAGDGTFPFHFIVNPHNVQWDGKGDVAAWNAQWRSKARVTKDEWVVEIAIPWAAVGGRTDSRVNLCRRRAATNELTAVVQNFTLAASTPAK